LQKARYKAIIKFEPLLIVMRGFSCPKVQQQQNPARIRIHRRQLGSAHRGLQEGLAELGWIKERNVNFAIRVAQGQIDRLPGLDLDSRIWFFTDYYSDAFANIMKSKRTEARYARGGRTLSIVLSLPDSPFMKRIGSSAEPAAMATRGGTFSSVSIFIAIIQRPKSSNQRPGN
jgi:hypothetical protein